MPCVNLIDTTERRVRSRNRRQPRVTAPVSVFEQEEPAEQAQPDYETFYEPAATYESSNFDEFGCPTFYNRGTRKIEKENLNTPAIFHSENTEIKEVETVPTRRTRFNTWIPVITY
jgi:hypothetical protein